MKSGKNKKGGVRVGAVAVVVCVCLCMITTAVSAWSAFRIVELERELEDIRVLDGGRIQENRDDLNEITAAVVELHENVEEIAGAYDLQEKVR